MPTTNRRIQTAAEVTALAAEPEGETVDYKGTAKAKEWWELAKDVAAFANHLGGVVVLGAFERADGLPELRGLPSDEVRELASAYEKVARDRCRPSPLVTCDRIPWDNGREMLAVNVRAATALVGAQFYKLRRDEKDPTGPLLASETNAWQFPVRVGKDNVPLPLEQAIMHMSTHARRIGVLLASIPKGARLRIHCVGLNPNPKNLFEPGDASLRSFSIEGNVAHVTMLDPEFFEANHAVPIDDIETVWEEEDGTWCIRVSGWFENWIAVKESKKTTTYMSLPRRSP